MHTNLHQSRTDGTLSKSLLMLSGVTIAQPAPRVGAPQIGDAMSDLIVIGYDSPLAADAARAALLAAAKEFAWEIEDALIARSDASGAIRFHQMADVWAIGASGGGLWGVLAGMLFINASLGGLVDAWDDGPEALTEYGIEADFMAEIAAMLSPGRAAFFLLIHSSPSEAMIDRLAATGAEIMRSRLDHRAEDSLRQVFARAPARTGTPFAG